MSLEYGFNDKMEAGKAAALARRNKGLPERKTKWAKPRPAEDTELNRAYADLAYLARELAEAKNQLAGGSQEPIDPWGAEFDRLSGRAERQGLPSLPSLSSSRSTTAARPRGSRKMTKQNSTEPDARAIVRKLLSEGLCSPSEAAELAGVTRQLVNYWAQGINWRKARQAKLKAAWNKEA